MAEVESDTEMQVDKDESDKATGKMNGDLNGSDQAMDTSECPSPVTVSKNVNRPNLENSNEDSNQSNHISEDNHSENNEKSPSSNQDSKSLPVDDLNDNDNEDDKADKHDDTESQNSESQNHNTDSRTSNHSISSNESLQSDFSNARLKENSEDTRSTKSVKPIDNDDGIIIPSDSDDDIEAINDETDEDDETLEEDIVSNGVSADEPMSIHSDSDGEEPSDDKTEKGDTAKVNGKLSKEVHEIEESDKEDCVISLDTPEKEKKLPESVPRRSSRNIVRKVYSEELAKERLVSGKSTPDVESDLEEVTGSDPLGDPLSGHKPGPKSKTKINNAPIVVKDTKRLVEITAKNIAPQGPNKSGKKSPTLVIIDTNSILSGRGAVPMNSKQTGYSVLPVAVPAQGMYPPNMRATITPVNNPVPKVVNNPLPPTNSVLPSLTDDMFVVEAPSFIVPYVYEKPPTEPFRQFVDKMGKEVEVARKLVEEQEKEELRKEEKQKQSENGDVEMKEVKENSESKKKSKKKRKQKTGDDDESWDENDTSDTEDEDDAVGEKVEKEVLVKDIKEDSLEAIKKHIITPETATTTLKPADKKSDSYFDNPIGKFFMNIGINLVQEYVQTDLLKQQKRKRDRESKASTSTTATQMAINSLIKNLEFSKENNEPYHFEQKKCEICNFKTESALALAHHMETPHMRNYFYRCNFCSYEIRSPHDILFHMEAEHNTRGRLERAPSYHQCPNCPFEDNGKAKLSRHQMACAKKFKPEYNLGPPVDWEPPAKIPRTSRPKQSLTSAATAYQQAMANQNRVNQPVAKIPGTGTRGRGRPAIGKTLPGSMVAANNTLMRGNMMYRPGNANAMPSSSQLLLQGNYAYGGNQLIQVVGTSVNMLPGMVATSSGSVTIQTTPSGGSSKSNNSTSSKLLHQPSISITPLPRQSASSTSGGGSSSSSSSHHQQGSSAGKPGQQTSGKASFVICEICDGYIKDLDQLRNHMQWIHKVKIHPKMIYNRPPLNCQKCQFRFFTDQGLERHLLGSHGLVTSSMQEAANKGKDAGRCPVCGRVYQWKLLNHVNRDHNMTLKPAHLSYKCTVCTATFGMYKQFENHVYSAHSVVAKKVMDKKPSSSSSSASANSSPLNKSAGGGDSLLKPLKINDEITIIPQPPKPRPGPASRTGGGASLTVTKK